MRTTTQRLAASTLAVSLAATAGAHACPEGSEEKEVLKLFGHNVEVESDGGNAFAIRVDGPDGQRTMELELDGIADIDDLIKNHMSGMGRGFQWSSDPEVHTDVRGHAKIVGPNGQVHELEFDGDDLTQWRSQVNELMQQYYRNPGATQGFLSQVAPNVDAWGNIAQNNQEILGMVSSQPSVWIGIQLDDAEPSLLRYLDIDAEGGTVIVEVVDDSPADDAGLRAKDIILEIDGEENMGQQKLMATLTEYDPGDEIEITIYRDGDIEEIELELAKRPGNLNAQQFILEDEDDRFGNARRQYSDALRLLQRNQRNKNNQRFQLFTEEEVEEFEEELDDRIGELEDRFDRLEEMIEELVERRRDR